MESDPPVQTGPVCHPPPAPKPRHAKITAAQSRIPSESSPEDTLASRPHSSQTPRSRRGTCWSGGEVGGCLDQCLIGSPHNLRVSVSCVLCPNGRLVQAAALLFLFSVS